MFLVFCRIKINSIFGLILKNSFTLTCTTAVHRPHRSRRLSNNHAACECVMMVLLAVTSRLSGGHTLRRGHEAMRCRL